VIRRLLLALAVLTAGASAADPAEWTWRDPMTAWAAGRGLRLIEVGTGPYRVVVAEEARRAPALAAAQAGAKAIAMLDQLTGGRAGFTATGGVEAAYRSVYLPDDRAVDAWIDEARRQGLSRQPSGADLAKSLHALPGPGIQVAAAPWLDRLPANCGTYDAVTMAIDGYYRRGSGGSRRAPAWIREGLVTTLQEALCGTITHTTVAYELSDRSRSGSWNAAVAKHLATPGVGQSARTLMGLDLDGMSIEIYQQLYSLMTFTLEAGKGVRVRKGAPTPMLRLLQGTAEGRAGDEVFAEVFAVKEPALTRSWQAWALKRK
jgi:hypothetical protein